MESSNILKFPSPEDGLKNKLTEGVIYLLSS